MMQRQHLVFAANFSDEVEFSEEGEIVVPAGREVAAAVVDSLNRRKLRCSDVVQRDYYGWEFRFAYRPFNVAAILQRIDKWIMTLELRSSLKNIFFRGPTCSAREVAQQVAQMLKADLPCEVMEIFSDDDFPY